MTNTQSPQNISAEILKILVHNSLALSIFNAFSLVCLAHRKMGGEGRKKDILNQFGEQTLRADFAAEQTFLEYLRKYAEEKEIILEVRGEETATSILGDKGKKYFAVLDGLDGSSNYLNPSEWPYGTMFAVAKGGNPLYRDFEVAGIGLPEENWILIAIKECGVFIYDIDHQIYRRIKSFHAVKYDETKILSDNYFPEAKRMLGKMQKSWSRSGSIAASIIAIVIGEQIADDKYSKMNGNWQGLADVTRKGNLEQPVSYLILSELGGVVVDKNGKDIGNRHFKNWGQNKKVPIISAKSQEIAKKILSKLIV